MKRALPWVLAGAGIATMAAVLIVTMRRPGEPLTLDRIEAAEKLWASRGIKDYDMHIRVSGVQQGFHHVEVRGGRVVTMTTGGEPVPESVWSYWSAEGMFAFLRRELQMSEKQRAVLLAEFDPQTGIPKHFFRHMMGQMKEIRWEVTSFEAR